MAGESGSEEGPDEPRSPSRSYCTVFSTVICSCEKIDLGIRSPRSGEEGGDHAYPFGVCHGPIIKVDRTDLYCMYMSAVDLNPVLISWYVRDGLARYDFSVRMSPGNGQAWGPQQSPFAGRHAHGTSVAC
jgi:hypothetical protein